MIPGVQETDPEFFDIYARVASTGIAEQTDRFLNALNSWFSMFIYSPKKDEFIIIFTNITDRKSHDQALRQSEEKHRRLFESMSQGVIYYDAAGKITSANYSAERILNLPRDQILGKLYQNARWNLLREDGSNLPNDEHPVVVALNTGRQIENFIIGVTIPTWDAPIWISTSAIPLFQPGQEKPYQVNSIFEDITERRQIEQTLRESKERFATIFRSSPNSIIIARLSDSCIIDVNAAFCSQYNLQREQVVGHSAQEFGLWENQADRGRLLGLIREHGQVSGFEAIYRSSTGASGVLLLSATQITLNDEACLLILGHDITKRKQLERALKDQSDFLQQIIITIGQGLTVTNADGRFEMVNPAYARLLGYTVEQLIDQVPPAVAFAEDSPALKLIQKKRLAGETNSYESQLVRADGSLVDVLVTCTPRLNDGTYSGSIAVVTDLTDIKRAEQLRHEAEERFNKVIRSSPIGIHILRMQSGRSQDANDTFLNLIGYSRAELLGHTAKELNLLVDPEQREAWMPTLLAEGRASDIETRLRTKNGEIRHVILSIETFKMHGETFMMTLMNDITSRKLSEIALKAAHDELEQHVLERTIDLRATNSALERALKARDEFMAVISHELRTPLTGILGLSQALQLSTYGELSQKQGTAVQNIEKSGQHLFQLINQILEFSKFQTGNSEIQLLAHSLNDICQASLLVVNMLATKKNQNITFEISPKDIVVNVDEQCIKQVLINLLGNAIKFTPDSGHIELKVIGLSDKQQVQISVTDTGIGIQEADLARLFQPFVQLDMRLSRSYDGTGMGLALVRQMVELHRGSVSVESVFGEGSRFTVCLPWQK
jgi:PAS domain S-box-containing protein